jgi:prepilin-type N-terminal cleavage/methylation domain-containing protein
MKVTKLHRQQGFSLIEVIAVLLLMGIVALALATTMVTAVEGYLFTKDSADGAQKAQLALARISKELLQATAITTATSNIVAYTTPAGSFQIVKNNDVITLQKTDSPVYGPQTMIDNVQTNYGTENFLVFEKLDGSSWSTADNINTLHAVKVTLMITGVSDRQIPTFKTMINPRQNDPQKENLRNVPRIISKAGFQLLPILDRDYPHEESRT